jgi:hypothetical protein
MALFSVVGRDDEPDDDSQAGASGPAVLSYLRAAASAQRGRAADVARGDAPRRSSPPEVVLELPDLSGGEHAVRSAVINRVYWAMIVLGALVALLLIWTPTKPARPSLNDAPAWSNTNSTLQPVATERDGQSPASSPASSAAPSYDGFGQQPQPSGLRTARGGDTRWDGTAPSIRPGEAAPTGRIINTLVTE